MYPQRHFPFADQVKVIGLFAFIENHLSGLEAYVGNAAGDGLNVPGGQFMEKRVRTQNALQRLHGNPPPSVRSCDTGLCWEEAKRIRHHNGQPPLTLGCSPAFAATLILLQRLASKKSSLGGFPNSLLFNRHEVCGKCLNTVFDNLCKPFHEFVPEIVVFVTSCTNASCVQ